MNTPSISDNSDRKTKKSKNRKLIRLANFISIRPVYSGEKHSPPVNRENLTTALLTGLLFCDTINTIKRREATGKGEKERRTMWTLSSKVPRREKKAFLRDQGKEREENSRMRNTRDVFKKIRDTKGTLHAKMSTIKDRNGIDQQKQKILRRGGKNTQKNYTKKIFMTQITTMGVIIHLEPDILECKVKRALGSITTSKASGSDGTLAELFQVLKDDAVKVLYSTCQQIWITQQWPQDWKRSVFTVIPKKGNAKECSNYRTTALILHTSKIIKILQARLQQYVNHGIPDVQGGFRKGRGTRDQIGNIHWIIVKAREFQKNIYFCITD